MTAERRVRVAVVSGGRSSEHEVSLRSAASVAAALDPARYEVIEIGIGRDGRWALPGQAPAALEPGERDPLVPARRDPATPAAALAVDVVFPVLHGPFGEDGTIQGLCELLGLPYVGSGVLGSALAMDKSVCKAVLHDAGIRTARSLTLTVAHDPPTSPGLAARVGEALGYPVFVKPARLGSSVGISRVVDAAQLPAALELAYRHDDKVLVEELVRGREVECGVLGNDDPIASVVGEIRPHTGWYDYAAKYDEGATEILIPAELPPQTVAAIQQAAITAFLRCDCAGMARVDFFLEPDGGIVLNEINTIPGFTATSVYASLFAASGIPYPDLVDRLVQLALERHERRSRLDY